MTADIQKKPFIITGMLSIILLGYRLLVKFGYINPNPADDGMRTDEEARVKQDKNNRSIEQRRVE